VVYDVVIVLLGTQERTQVVSLHYDYWKGRLFLQAPLFEKRRREAGELGRESGLF